MNTYDNEHIFRLQSKLRNCLKGTKMFAIQEATRKWNPQSQDDFLKAIEEMDEYIANYQSNKIKLAEYEYILMVEIDDGK